MQSLCCTYGKEAIKWNNPIIDCLKTFCNPKTDIKVVQSSLGHSGLPLYTDLWGGSVPCDQFTHRALSDHMPLLISLMPVVSWLTQNHTCVIVEDCFLGVLSSDMLSNFDNH